MYGLPEARFEDEVKTFNFLKELKPDDVGIFSFTPYPGTPHYDAPETQGMRLLIPDLNRLSLVDAPVHDTNYLTREEIIKFQLTANYIWRSKKEIAKGIKPRRKRDVALVKTNEGGLVYDPFVPEHKRTTDMYLSSTNVDEITFDILFYCDGYHSTDCIAQKVARLYCLDENKSKERVLLNSTFGSHFPAYSSIFEGVFAVESFHILRRNECPENYYVSGFVLQS